MIVLPVLVLVAITFLLPHISLLVNQQLPQLSAQFYKYLSPSDIISEEVIIEDVPVEVQSAQVDNDQLLPPLPLLKFGSDYHHLLYDFKHLVNETKVSIQSQWVQLHDEYAPDQLKQYEQKANEFFKSEQVAHFLNKYEKPINNLIIGIAILIALRITKIIFKRFNTKKTTIPKEALTIEATQATVFQDYNVETIPLCVGKGDAEELQLFNSYSEILQNSNDSDILKKYGFDIDSLSNSNSNTNSNGANSILGNLTPNGLNSPTDYTASDISAIFQSKTGTPIQLDQAPLDESIDSVDSNSNSNSSPSPNADKDSFERHENLLDDQLAHRLNSTPMQVSESSKSSTFEKYSTSPSKKLVYKKSTAILTSAAFPTESIADTTVGDITTETVYSEPFASDAETSFKNSL